MAAQWNEQKRKAMSERMRKAWVGRKLRARAAKAAITRRERAHAARQVQTDPVAPAAAPEEVTPAPPAAPSTNGLHPFVVIADRTTEYRVMAKSAELAIDAVIAGQGEEVDQTTHKIAAERDDK